MRATPESPQMFESEFFDGFSRTPWWTVPLLWLPGASAFFVYGVAVAGVSLTTAVGLALFGWLAWTFAEYWLHRTFFHWSPNTSWGPKLHFIVHGVHHKWVMDPYRLVMPPAVSLGLCVLFGAFWRLVWGPALAWPFFGGFVFGYMVYDVTHYATHHLKYKGATFQALKKHHLLHHHSPRHADRKFGVSTTLWDHVFRTW